MNSPVIMRPLDFREKRNLTCEWCIYFCSNEVKNYNSFICEHFLPMYDDWSGFNE